MPTDYHEAIRDAVATTLAALALEPPVRTLNAIEDAARDTVPAIEVCVIGPVQIRPEWGTNRQNGLSFPILACLFQQGTSQGVQSPGGLSPTLFWQYLMNAFHMKRLSGVEQVGYCEVSESGPIWSAEQPAFQKLSRSLVVNAIGRFPRS